MLFKVLDYLFFRLIFILYDIRHSKVISLVNLHINYVSLEGKHISGCSIAQEVNSINHVIFVKDIGILVEVDGRKHGADPGTEARVLALEEDDFVISRLVHDFVDFMSERYRKLFYKVKHIDTILDVWLNQGKNRVVQFGWEVIVLVNLVQNDGLLLIFLILPLSRLNHVCDWSRHVREEEHSNEHQ